MPHGPRPGGRLRRNAGLRGAVARRHRGVAPSHRRRVHAARPPERPRPRTRGEPGQGARARARPAGAAAGDAARTARPRARSRAFAPDVHGGRRLRAAAAAGDPRHRRRLGCLNVHASLLPRWRGAAPVARAILAGDARTGVCIMRMEAGLDTGPVMLAPRDRDRRARDRGRARGAARATRARAAIVEALDALAAGRAEFAPQDPARATYAAKLDQSRGAPRLARGRALALERRVRALNPRPVAETTLDGAQLRIHEAAPSSRQRAGAVPGHDRSRADADGIVVHDGRRRAARSGACSCPGRRAVGAARARRTRAPLVGHRCSPEHAGRRRDPRRGRARRRRRRDARPPPRGRGRRGDARAACRGRRRSRSPSAPCAGISSSTPASRGCSTARTDGRTRELRAPAARRPLPAAAWRDARARGGLGNRRGGARARPPARGRPRQRGPAPLPARARGDRRGRARGSRPRGSRTRPGCSTPLRATGPERWESIAAAGNAEPPMWLRVNARRGTRDAYRARLDAAGLGAEACEFAPEALRLAEPTRRQCAARLCGRRRLGAGRRRAARAALPRGRGRACACWTPARRRAARPAISLELEPGLAELVALDVDAERAARIESNLARLGLAARVVVARRASNPRSLVGRPAIRAHPARRALFGHRRDPPPSRHQAAAPGRRRRALCDAAVGAAGRLLGACSRRAAGSSTRAARCSPPKTPPSSAGFLAGEPRGGGGDRIC